MGSLRSAVYRFRCRIRDPGKLFQSISISSSVISSSRLFPANVQDFCSFINRGKDIEADNTTYKNSRQSNTNNEPFPFSRLDEFRKLISSIFASLMFFPCLLLSVEILSDPCNPACTPCHSTLFLHVEGKSCLEIPIYWNYQAQRFVKRNEFLA